MQHNPRTSTVRLLSSFSLSLTLLLCGCASVPEQVGRLDADPAAIELADTPFFPQERYQCGPAALTTVLVASGADVGLEDIERKVYLPGRRGSLQVELEAATRTSGRLPYIIDGTLEALHAELSAGRPVIVLQNLGIAALPKWHYAVVVGIDADERQVVLRSGDQKRRVTKTNTFLRTWRRGDYWAMVALRPDEMPARVEQRRYFGNVAELEQAGMFDAAALAWETALQRWPNDPVALFGLANVSQALGDHAAAERHYGRLLRDHPDLVPARNNLALALAKQGKAAAAIREIDLALATNTDPALAAELQLTRTQITESRTP